MTPIKSNGIGYGGTGFGIRWLGFFPRAFGNLGWKYHFPLVAAAPVIGKTLGVHPALGATIIEAYISSAIISIRRRAGTIFSSWEFDQSHSLLQNSAWLVSVSTKMVQA